MLCLQKDKGGKKKETEQISERCFESNQRTSYVRLGMFTKLIIEAERVAREYSVLPLPWHLLVGTTGDRIMHYIILNGLIAR